MLLLLTLACSGSEPTAPTTPEPAVEAVDPASEAVALARASEGMKAYGGALKSRLLEEMGKGDAAAAAAVCATDAPAIAAQVAQDKGVTVGRSTSKQRNPANHGPEWVQARQAQAESQVKPDGLSEVLDGEARVLKPIYIEGPCLSCHGPPESIAESTRAFLAERYPEDAATGYSMGQLRGAVWATSAVR